MSHLTCTWPARTRSWHETRPAWTRSESGVKVKCAWSAREVRVNLAWTWRELGVRFFSCHELQKPLNSFLWVHCSLVVYSLRVGTYRTGTQTQNINQSSWFLGRTLHFRLLQVLRYATRLAQDSFFHNRLTHSLPLSRLERGTYRMMYGTIPVG